jgi:hypothetical protein
MATLGALSSYTSESLLLAYNLNWDQGEPATGSRNQRL